MIISAVSHRFISPRQVVWPWFAPINVMGHALFLLNVWLTSNVLKSQFTKADIYPLGDGSYCPASHILEIATYHFVVNALRLSVPLLHTERKSPQPSLSGSQHAADIRPPSASNLYNEAPGRRLTCE